MSGSASLLRLDINFAFELFTKMELNVQQDIELLEDNAYKLR